MANTSVIRPWSTSQPAALTPTDCPTKNSETDKARARLRASGARWVIWNSRALCSW